jgi:hypothetical protein
LKRHRIEQKENSIQSGPRDTVGNDGRELPIPSKENRKKKRLHANRQRHNRPGNWRAGANRWHMRHLKPSSDRKRHNQAAGLSTGNLVAINVSSHKNGGGGLIIQLHLTVLPLSAHHPIESTDRPS